MFMFKRKRERGGGGRERDILRKDTYVLKREKEFERDVLLRD